MYTHKVKFKVGDGSKFIEADLGIDEDNELVYKFTSASQPLNDSLLEYFLEFTDLVKRMGIEFTGMKEVSIIKD